MSAAPQMVEIARMGAQGDAVAMTADGPLFVPGALPGETVRVERDGERARLEEVIAPSAERVAPVCRHFGVCGGCQLQHWRADAYAAWKRGLVVEALARERIETEIAPLVDAHGAGRRRAIFHARFFGRRVVLGFAERRSHAMVPLEECPVLAPALWAAVPALREAAALLGKLGKPLDLQATLTDTGLDVDVRGSGPLPPQAFADLAALAQRSGFARLTRHGELVVQQIAPAVAMGAARVALPPASFLQATAAGEETLAGLVTQAVGPAKRVADLFAGAGTFALRLAHSARVAAFESNAPAVAALVQASQGVRGLKAVTGEVRDLFRRPLMPAELAAYDAVVMDPPRQGAEAQAQEIARAKVGLLAYVSCSAATFARDARILMDGGWRLAAVTPVDQFRYSPHVELVGVFRR